MFEKKKNYAQGEMRPLSALAKKETDKPAAPSRKTVPPQTPVSPQIQNTVQTLSVKNHVADTATVSRTPLRAASMQAKTVPTPSPEREKSKAQQTMQESILEIPMPQSLPPERPTNHAARTENTSYRMPQREETNTISALRQKQVAAPAQKAEPVIATAQEAPKAQPKPEVKPEIRRQPQPRPLPKLEEARAATVTRRRRADAPNLSDKAARDAFFSRYGTPPKKDTAQEIAERIASKEPEMHAADTSSRKSSETGSHTGVFANPFRNRPSDRPVISHAKEEPAEQKAQPEKLPEEKLHIVDEAPPEMAETIENAAKAVRRERERINALNDDGDMKEAERRSAVIRAVMMTAVLAGCGLFLLLGKRSDFSAEENRKLAEMPEFSMQSYLSGEYTKGVSAYYNDTVPMRSTFKRAIASMEDWMGLPSDEEEEIAFFGNISVKDPNAQHSDNAVPDATEAGMQQATTQPAIGTMLIGGEESTEDVTDVTELLEDMTDAAEETTEEEAVIAEDIEVGDSIIIHNKRAISFYGGWIGTAERYANVLNDYKEQLGKDVNVYSLIAPTAVSYYLPKEYSDYTYSEEENINHANSFMDGVTPVNVYDVLEAHKNEEIYARTDHHWLPLGAYYAAQEFAKTAGVPFTDISQMDSESRDDYVGSMYTFTSSTILSENPETFTYYKPKNKYKTTYYDCSFGSPYEDELFMNMDFYDPVNYYLVFMGGDDKITHIETDVDNDRTLVIFKDSYGNAMVPCLVGSFSDIYVCDIRYFYPNAASFCQQVGATDVLFAMNTFSATGINVECIEQILYYQ